MVKTWSVKKFWSELLAQGQREGVLGGANQPETLEQSALSLIDEGNVIEDEGRIDEAMRYYEGAIRLAPNLARAHLNRGNILLAKDKAEEALEAYASALFLNPDYAAAHYNLGKVNAHMGRNEAALTAYREAIRLNPDFVDAEVALGCVQEDIGRFEDAAASYRRALEIRPDYAEAYGNLGNALRNLGRFNDAVESYRRALEIKPDYAGVRNNLGTLLQELGQIGSAVVSFRRALEIAPDSADAHSNLLFCLSHSEAVDAQALFAEHCRFAEHFEAPLQINWPQHTNSRKPDRCLQIGFVSGDLRSHAVASFIEPVLAHLAGYPQLSLHAYYNHAVEDRVTQRLRGYLTHWHSIVGLSDVALARKIIEDGIDILFDLSGHTGKNRLLGFARKPAPVQVSWIGYPGTTGLKSMDYYLSDRFFLPPGQFDEQFTEKIVYLPASAPFVPLDDAPPVNALPALSNGYVTFGSFNRPSKLSPSVIALWSQLLRALPDARMVLGAMPQTGENDTLIEWFAREGIARERLSFHPKCQIQDYLCLHHQVDLCLDTFPYNGGTTTCHALWMGVPTLTLAGDRVPARQGATVLGHAGLEVFVAYDAADFVEKGLNHARNIAMLASLRTQLRERFAQTSMVRPGGVAAGLECALRIMWQRWCAGLPAESFAVPPQGLGNAIQEADK